MENVYPLADLWQGVFYCWRTFPPKYLYTNLPHILWELITCKYVTKYAIIFDALCKFYNIYLTLKSLRFNILIVKHINN